MVSPKQSHMPVENRQSIIDAARALYDSRLPYHNFEHISEVLSVSEKLLEKCQEENISVDSDVVFYALLFHDAGYQEDSQEKGFSTKEAYSAHLAEQILQKHQFSDSFIAQVKQAINSTHQDAVCVSNEDKLVKNSDLFGLSADYEEFKQASVRLLEEYNLLNNKNVEWKEWTKMAAVRLEKYLDNSIFLTSDYFDPDGKSWFIENTQNNIQKLLADKN